MGADAAGDDGARDAAQQAWVELARQATVKRMRDEIRLWRRSGSSLACPREDAGWQQALRREPGAARERVAGFGARIAAGLEAAGAGAGRAVPDVFLRLRLLSAVASDLLACVEAARRGVARTAASVPWDVPWPDEDPPPSLRMARHFFIRCWQTPSWVGLLAMIEQFVDVRDARGRRGQADDELFVRDGWRCTAPGCSSRRHLEDHHVVYRSRGGGDLLSNGTPVCRFHHQRGEHGGWRRAGAWRRSGWCGGSGAAGPAGRS